MDILTFKQNLKSILNGKTGIEFTIYSTEIEVFSTKKSFGERLLELFADSKVKNVSLRSFQEKGCYGIVTNGFYTLLNSKGLGIYIPNGTRK